MFGAQICYRSTAHNFLAPFPIWSMIDLMEHELNSLRGLLVTARITNLLLGKGGPGVPVLWTIFLKLIWFMNIFFLSSTNYRRRWVCKQSLSKWCDLLPRLWKWLVQVWLWWWMGRHKLWNRWVPYWVWRTPYPMKHAHRFVRLWFVVVISSNFKDSLWSIYPYCQHCFPVTGVAVLLFYCERSHPE